LIDTGAQARCPRTYEGKANMRKLGLDGTKHSKSCTRTDGSAGGPPADFEGNCNFNSYGNCKGAQLKLAATMAKSNSNP